ncbi:hypothetical protein EBU99_06000 [bacterium]|nr:hypothetical protein [bacterium]
MTNLNSEAATTGVPSRHKAWWVLGGLTILSVLMGGLTSLTYRQTELHLVKMYNYFDNIGRTASAEKCVDEVVAWLPRCDGMKALCEGAVPRMMDKCLAAQNRASECSALSGRPADAHYGFHECEARKLPRFLNKVCGNSYKSLDLHCRALGYLPAAVEKYQQ